MKTKWIGAAVAAVVVASGALAQEDEHDFAAGDIVIEHPWARAASAGSDTLVFLETENAGPADTLASASMELAATVEIVGLTLTGDQIAMIPIGPVEIPSGTFELDPGGLALALRGLTQTLNQGDEVELTLKFEHAGAVEIHVLVEAADAMAHSHAH